MGYNSLETSRATVKFIKKMLKEITDSVDLLEQDLEGRITEMEMTNANTAEKSTEA